MWSDDERPFKSEHIRAQRLLNSPQALTKPHPPIMIGGGGEKKTLRFVAKYGQACNLFNRPDLEHKLEVLRGHCAAEGRDYDEIVKTVYHVLDPGPNGERAGELEAESRRIAGLGVDAVIGGIPGGPTPGVIDVFAKRIIPEAASY